MTTAPVLAELWRGETIESCHRGALAVVDAAGVRVVMLGDIERPVFPRSAIKAWQALPLVASGTAARLRLDDEALALACASHGGEAAHVRVATDMLACVGLDAGVLECGSHWPSHDRALRELAAQGQRPGPLHNNCSGKHAGFVCLGAVQAADAGREPRAWLRGYVWPDHALMREVDAAIGAVCGVDLARAPRATDGCSIPTYALPLQALAWGFARFGTGIGLSPAYADAAQRLRAAVAAAPFMVAGEGRFDTRVMERLGARAFVKVGAEGVYGAALPHRGLGVALKIDDGQTRAAETVMAAVLEGLLRLEDEERSFLRGWSEAVQRNWNGIEVGQLRASATLRDALKGLA